MTRPEVDLAQTPWEFSQLLDVLDCRELRGVLEVGIWEGGTLWYWLFMGGFVVAIDDAMRAPGPDVWNAWAEERGVDLTLVHGSSHASEVIGRASQLGPYDMVFIDADHTYESVRADWDNYRLMVAAGGIVVFHDIVERPGYGVSRLWDEIKPRHRTVEIVDGGGRFNGIGVVYL